MSGKLALALTALRFDLSTCFTCGTKIAGIVSPAGDQVGRERDSEWGVAGFRGRERGVEAITQIRRFRFTRRRIEMCVPHEARCRADAFPSSATSRRGGRNRGRGSVGGTERGSVRGFIKILISTAKSTRRQQSKNCVRRGNFFAPQRESQTGENVEDQDECRRTSNQAGKADIQTVKAERRVESARLLELLELSSTS